MTISDSEKICCGNCRYFQVYPQLKRTGYCMLDFKYKTAIGEFPIFIKSASDICDYRKENDGYRTIHDRLMP